MVVQLARRLEQIERLPTERKALDKDRNVDRLAFDEPPVEQHRGSSPGVSTAASTNEPSNAAITTSSFRARS